MNCRRKYLNKKMDNQSPSYNHQINSNHQYPNPKRFSLVKLVIRYWLLFGYCGLVIGVLPVYSLNLDKIKVSFLEGDYKAAIREGEKLLAGQAQAGRSDELYYILGLSYAKDGNYLRASDIFEIILKEFKNSAFTEQARLGLGDTYFFRGDYNQAEGYFKELLDKYPGTKFKAQVYYRLSQVGFKKGDTQEGQAYLEKLRQEFPANTELIFNRELGALPDYHSDFFYTVQVGFFSRAENARNLTDKLSQAGYAAYFEEVALKGAKAYRVKVGKVKSRAEAAQLENKLLQQGYPTKICP